MSGRARTCPVCLRPIPADRSARAKNCSRSCTIRAAELRRQGAEPVQPGYVPGAAPLASLERMIESACNRKNYAIRQGHWHEAQAFEAAEAALRIARSARNVRRQAAELVAQARRQNGGAA